MQEKAVLGAPPVAVEGISEAAYPPVSGDGKSFWTSPTTT